MGLRESVSAAMLLTAMACSGPVSTAVRQGDMLAASGRETDEHGDTRCTITLDGEVARILVAKDLDCETAARIVQAFVRGTLVSPPFFKSVRLSAINGIDHPPIGPVMKPGMEHYPGPGHRCFRLTTQDRPRLRGRSYEVCVEASRVVLVFYWDWFSGFRSSLEAEVDDGEGF